MIRAVVACVLLAACSSSDPAPVWGDPDAPMQLEMFHLDEHDALVTTAPGDHVPLRIPPQGGWAVILGVRAANVTGGAMLNLTTSFRDLCDDSILKVDSRSVKLEDNGDGRAFTTLDTVSNLQLCPNPAALRNLYDQPFRFTVELTDGAGKHGQEDIQFVPVCPAGSEMCACECDQRYVLGTCPPTGTPKDPPTCAAP